MIDSKKIVFETSGSFDMVNLTKEITTLIRNGSIESGVVNIYSHGSTAAIVTLGSEEGIKEDFIEAVKRIIPDGKYKHDEKTNHRNGVSHIRSAILGTGLSIPFSRKRMFLGMFQQIYFVDLDSIKREREVIVQIIGE